MSFDESINVLLSPAVGGGLEVERRLGKVSRGHGAPTVSRVRLSRVGLVNGGTFNA